MDDLDRKCQDILRRTPSKVLCQSLLALGANSFALPLTLYTTAARQLTNAISPGPSSDMERQA